MPPSVRTVTDLPGLGLRRLAGPDGRDRPVRWVAVSELEDPTPFLEGGELLLSTGMRLPADDRDALAGVRRPPGRRRTWPRSGSGWGSPTTRSPPGWSPPRTRAGLPLLEVPAATAFIAVSKAVSALLGAEEYDAITRAFQTQRDLTRAALGARRSGSRRGAARPAHRRLGAGAGRDRARAACGTRRSGCAGRRARGRPARRGRGAARPWAAGLVGRGRRARPCQPAPAGRQRPRARLPGRRHAGAAGPAGPVGGRGRGVAALATSPSRRGRAASRGWPGSAAPR